MSQFHQHQQQLLNMMGIISWVERTQGTAQLSHEIWQDVNMVPQSSQLEQKNKLELNRITLNIEKAEKLSSEILLKTEDQQVQQSIDDSPIVAVETLQEISATQLSSEPLFKHDIQLEILCTEYLAILVDMRGADEVQQQLWKNIQQSIQNYQVNAELLYLNWSYTWLDDQVNKHLADYYLKGYLDYYLTQKTLFVLGDLPFYQEEFKQYYQYRAFATLAELQNTPQNKRILWQAIQAMIKT